MTTLHVATDGDDSKDGSASSPLRTISRAADLARLVACLRVLFVPDAGTVCSDADVIETRRFAVARLVHE